MRSNAIQQFVNAENGVRCVASPRSLSCLCSMPDSAVLLCLVGGVLSVIMLSLENAASGTNLTAATHGPSVRSTSNNQSWLSWSRADRYCGHLSLPCCLQ